MDPYGPPRKRPRGDVTSNGSNGNGYHSHMSNDLDLRRYSEDKDFGGGGGPTNRTKPCTKFFSTSGCPYGEGCHFLHYVPGGISSFGMGSSVGTSGTLSGGNVRKILGPPATPPSSALSPGDQGSNLGGFKTRLCNRFETSEGCRFGDKCHFAHGEKELRKSNGGTPHISDRDLYSSLELPRERISASSIPSGGYRSASGALYAAESRYAGLRESIGRAYGSAGLSYREPTPPGLAAAASFGASSTAKISIEASLAGAIIGKGGVNAKQICRLTGAKLSIRDHESDPALRNVEMEGSFEQIKQASQMVRQVLMHRDTVPAKPSGFGSHNFKTKICENYSQGTCTFGERCHFAHGANELRDHTLRA